MEEVVKIITIADASSAYTLDLGFVPDYVEVKAVTHWAATAQGKRSEAWWYNGMGAGYAALLTNEAANPVTKRAPSIITTNGFTVYDASSFAARQQLIDTGATKITQALRPIVTSTGHGLTTGDKVTFQMITSGMTEINSLSSKVTVINANSFYIEDIDTSGFTAWDAVLASGMFIKTSHLVDNEGFRGVIIGTGVLDTDDTTYVVRAVATGNFETLNA